MTGCIHRSVSNSNIIIAGSSCSRWQQRQRHTAKHYVASESTGNPQSYIGHFFHQIPLPPPPIAPEIIRATFDLGLQTLTIKLLFLSPVWNKFGSICFLIFPFLQLCASFFPAYTEALSSESVISNRGQRQAPTPANHCNKACIIQQNSVNHAGNVQNALN